MKRMIICNVSMKEYVHQVVYKSNDISLPVSERAVWYPINAFLEKILKPQDELKVLLLIKEDKYSFCETNAKNYITELNEINENIGARIDYKSINTEFSQSQGTHEMLMAKIVDEVETESHIIADITYGSKDMPIVLFSALNFAEKFLNCEIDNIVYGQANFVNGNPINTKICDMISLYYLNSVTETIKCNDPIKAKQMLETLLSL